MAPPGPKDSIPDRPLEPPPLADKPWLGWLIALFLLNILGAAWLAMRASSPEHIRETLDQIIQVGVGAAAAYLGYHLLTRFPFRTLDLLAMVMILAGGVQLTMSGIRSFTQASLLMEGPLDSRHNLPAVIQACLFTACGLMAGAALGLRSCQRLCVVRPLLRIWIIFCGMMILPATAGALALAAVLAGVLLSWAPPRSSPEEGLLYSPGQAAEMLGLWMICVLVTLCNAFYLLKSVSLTAEVPRRKAE